MVSRPVPFTPRLNIIGRFTTTSMPETEQQKVDKRLAKGSRAVVCHPSDFQAPPNSTNHKL
jgi:hypothetical protein